VTINRPLTIASQPAPQTILLGSTATLTVSATGTAPFSYQWYRGDLGSTAAPVGTNAPTFTTPALAADTSYWVKVTNVAGSINSRAALVTINRPPTIVSQPTSQTVLTGSTATMTVSATGSAPFSYQWYRGDLGSTATPVGTNAPTFTTPALAVTTKYWVKISNQFGEIPSSSVTITVQANTAPTISDIADQNVIVGSNIGSIAFTIGDAQTSASALTLSGSSSNTTLVSNASIVFGGSGASRTVTVTPTIGQRGTATITVTVSDGSLVANDAFVLTVVNLPATPLGFSLIPAGSFTMEKEYDGHLPAVGWSPPTTKYVSAFYIAQRETTKALWDEVWAWGRFRGYTDLPVGGGKASNHPVHTVTWFDAIKWCNARSEMEGLTPCYTYGGFPLRRGTYLQQLGGHMVEVWWAFSLDPTANGYRLPTQAEWEWAARGGLKEKRFPWGDTITHNQANYFSASGLPYDLSPTRGHHPTYAVGNKPYTSPVASFAANGYGLSDMAGNVEEWCVSNWAYAGPAPFKGDDFRPRGGSWRQSSGAARVSLMGWAQFESPLIEERELREQQRGFRVVLPIP
jgi:formylglycine-generating enzyme required for sulfatase activity